MARVSLVTLGGIICVRIGVELCCGGFWDEWVGDLVEMDTWRQEMTASNLFYFLNPGEAV